MTGRVRDGLTDLILVIAGLVLIADGAFGSFQVQWHEVAIGACLLYLGVLFPIRALMTPGARPRRVDGSSARHEPQAHSCTALLGVLPSRTVPPPRTGRSAQTSSTQR